MRLRLHPIGSLVALLALSIAQTHAKGVVDPQLPSYTPATQIKGNLSSVGDDDMAPLMDAWLQAFQKFQPLLQKGPRWQHLTSATAVAALALEIADIAPIAREPWPAELAPYAHQFAGDMMKEPLLVRVATGSFIPAGQVGALGVHVHASNPLAHLTLAQVDAIFSSTRRRGAIASPRTWGDLGLTGEWATRPIVRITLPAHSSVTMFAQRRILLGGFWHADLDEQPNLAAVMKAIAAQPGAIGIAGFLASPAADTHALALAESTAEPFVTADAATIADGRYPLHRPLYLAVNKRPDSPLPENVREFLRFVLSREGQEIVARYAHFFPLNAELAARERAALNGWLPPIDAELPTYVKSSQPVRGTIRSVGSDGMASLMNGWMRAFREVQPEVHPGDRWEHPGTINGFNALVAGETDLAPMGRELWPVEKLVHGITRGKNTLLEIRVARGGHATNGRTETIALVVNATNPLAQLNLKQLDALFGRELRSGSAAPLTRWGQLGLDGDWAQRPITLWVPPRTAPHMTWFQEFVLHYGPWNRTIHEATPTETIAAVARDPGAIGLAFFEEVTPGTRALPLALRDDTPACAGTTETIASRAYPLIRSMYIRLECPPGSTIAPPIREFLTYILSREGQERVRTSGYFPLTAAEAAVERAKLH